jgi:hypothetical protein
MSYLINQTNGQLIINLQDGTADGPDINPGLNSSDVNLFGHNYPLFGRLQNENFIKLLQNFANATPPSNPLIGELWYDTSTSFLKIYNGTTYIPVSPLISSASQPSTTLVGTNWWDTTNQQLKIFNGSDWTTIGPGYSSTLGLSGAIVDTILGTDAVTHTVIKMYTGGNLISILSSS